MNLLPFSRKSMRVQDLKQQTAIRLAQEQQRQNTNEGYGQQNATHQQWNNNRQSHQNENSTHQHRNEYNHSHQGPDSGSGYTHQNYPGASYQQNHEYRRGQQDAYGHNFGPDKDSSDRKPYNNQSKQMSPSSASHPSTPRNRHHSKTKQMAREKKHDNKAVEQHGLVSPNSHVVSSPYAADHQPYKGKQGSVGKNQIKLSKAKDQRRNQESMEVGIKPNHSPMGRHHGKTVSRHPSSSSHGGGQQYNSQYYHNMHQAHVSTPRANTQRYTPNKSSKLPHGLTVQELKEMTKARLAAEAFENQEHESQTDYHVPVSQKKHPVDYKAQSFSPAPSSMYHNESSRQDSRYRHYQQNRQRIHSEGLATSDYVMRQRLNSAESAASAPPMTRYGTHGDQSLVRNISQNSLSDQFQNVNQDLRFQQQINRNDNSTFNNSNSSKAVQSFEFGHSVGQFSTPSPNKGHGHAKDFRYNQDVLDTASVNSINSGLEQEYAGTDSTQPPGLYNQMNNQNIHDGDSRYAFGRSCSYPAGTNLGYAIENTRSTSAFSPCHNTNRSRAATASPHGLSHVLEDRPAMDGINGNFSESSHDITLQPPKITSVIEDYNNSPRGSNCSSPASSRFGACNFIPDSQWYDIFGRPSSSTTVPTVEQPTESFYINDDDTHQPNEYGPPSHTNSLRVNSAGSAVPSSVAESVLGSSILGNVQKQNTFQNVNSTRDSTVGGVSGVFRNVDQHYSGTYSSANTITQNKTFDSGIIGQKTSSSNSRDIDHFGDFNQNSGSGRSDIYNENEYITGSASMLRLENDLNSLLNITGDDNEIQNHHSSNLIPKIDPEIDVTTSQPSLVANSSSSASDIAQNFTRNDNISSKKNSFLFF